MKPRLAIVLTHPIQYYTPIFSLLTRKALVDIKVFYTWSQISTGKRFDPGFGREVEWDIPLLEGYAYEFLGNTSAQPGSHHFRGIVNPDAIAKIESFEPDAILIFGWAFVSHLRIMRYFKNKIPVIFRGDSTLLDEKKGLKTLARYWFLRWVYSHIDKALYVGKSNYDYYIKFGIKPAQLVWAPHAVDNQRFIVHNKDYTLQARTIRQSLNIGEADFVFLFAGKFEPKKDPELLLNSFLRSGLGKSVHLVLAGNGVLEESLKIKSKDAVNVHFLGFQNQQAMPALYRVGDVFVLPSGGPGETWGLAVNEAMACSRPLIVSDKCGCAADLVENGVNGNIFAAGNEDDLIEKMVSSYQQRDKLPAMQNASLAKIKEYSIESICNALELTLRMICNKDTVERA